MLNSARTISSLFLAPRSLDLVIYPFPYIKGISKRELQL